MDYQNGKIYKITNCIDDEVYVGSTCQSLSKRYSKHKDTICLKPHFYLYQHMVKLGIDRFCITLIEDYPCSNKTELRQREGKFIREQGTLNQRVEGRTDKQFYQDNRDKIIEERRQYVQENKEKLKEKGKEYYQNNREKRCEYSKEYWNKNIDTRKQKNTEYYHSNTDKVKETQKKYREENKEKLKIRKTEKIECDICKSTVQRSYMFKHKKTDKCKSFIVNGNIAQ
jgi:hypothetical protein